MQTNRTRLPGNAALGRGEYQVGLRAPAERERERLDRFWHQSVEDPGPPLVRDLDQPGFTQHTQVMGDGRL